MDTIVRVHSVQVHNLKNVKQGLFKTNSTFDNLKHADIIGFYGQNGSGKTAIVEAFSILKSLLSTGLEKSLLPKKSKNLLCAGQDYLQITFQFLISNEYGEYIIKYDIALRSNHERLQIANEILAYKENVKGQRFKTIISKVEDVLKISGKSINKLNQTDQVTMLVANKMASSNHTSFIFREELREIFQHHLPEIEINLLKNLYKDFLQNLHIINNIQYGLLIANIVTPFSVYLNSKHGHIPTEMHDTMLVTEIVFETIQNVIAQTNTVLSSIVPGLEINIRVVHKQKMMDGSDGVKIELLSKRGNTELPLRCESEGILKLISILSTLIAVFNHPNTCVVIDELDAGVFEYLLGELLVVLLESGRGQLFFTSHNLRILEVLPVSCIWFTTTNEEQRYIQLRGIKKPDNIRDEYLRAVQIGGQQEPLYEETNLYDIKRSFRKAGIYYE